MCTNMSLSGHGKFHHTYKDLRHIRRYWFHNLLQQILLDKYKGMYEYRQCIVRHFYKARMHIRLYL